MGYVHDTQISQFVSPFKVGFSAGTWTPTIASNVPKNVRTAGAAAFTALIPIELPANVAGLKGARLKTIDVWYKILTADATDFATVELEKLALTANTVAITGSAPAITFDSAHDTAAKRKAQAEHMLTVTLTTPVWIGANDVYYLELLVDCAATTVFTLFGTRCNYDLRV